MPMADAIEDQIITLFKAVSALDEVTFDTEERVFLPNGFYPVLIISIDEQDEIDELLGDTGPESGLIKYLYSGHIAIETRMVDTPHVKNRVVERGSKSTIRTLLNSATSTLELYPRLDNFVFSAETVRAISRGIKTHGFIERGGNLFNRGEMPFSVETHKERGT